MENKRAENSNSGRQIRLSNCSYTCPCCGYMSFDEPPGSYDICPICFWEDDAVQLAYPYCGGANLPLVMGQKNYALYGACDEGIMKFVRPPMEGDVRDPQWRVFDPTVDSAGIGPQDGLSYFETVCSIEGKELLYYWRRRKDTSTQ